ncbi:MAG: hypothetical protein ACK5X3_09615, partial [Pseudomonadota bacterium]
QEYRKFLFDLKELVARTRTFPMPDYDLELNEQREGHTLSMRRRRDGEGAPTSPTAPQGNLPLLAGGGQRD